MATWKSFAQKTNAANKSIGFTYQYYYFIDKLLNLKTGESVGLEMLDDVHVTLNTGMQLLFQLKHTTSTTTDGRKPTNLTSLDNALWNTMPNWSKMISDVNVGRAPRDKQLDFIKRTEFHLVTNKSSNLDNQFLSKLSVFLEGLCEFSSLFITVSELKNQTSNPIIKQYIADVLSLDEPVIAAFFRKLRFQLDENELTAKIRRSIAEKFIDEKDIDDVYARLISNIGEDNFIQIKAGEPICISYEEFKNKYMKIFTSARSNKLTPHNYQHILPDDLLNQRFISQLLHINDVHSEDLETIAQYTIQKLQLATNLSSWHQSGLLIADEVSVFHNEVKTRWQNLFRAKFRPHKSSVDTLYAAVELLDELRNIQFKIAEQELSTELSNGELYNLSDLNDIGWHPGWEKL